jgi:hypothetical protein
LGIAQSLERLAAVSLALGQPEHAARIAAAAEGIREAIGAPLPPSERPEHDADLTAARAQLGDATFASVWAGGHTMTWEKAVEYALTTSEF